MSDRIVMALVVVKALLGWRFDTGAEWVGIGRELV
jgi:hypothetical protein